MLPLVELPEIVRPYAPWFAAVFSPEACAQFQRDISGLIVSETKTVEGINRIFVIDVRNQSSLTRWLTGSPFAVDALHQARLERLSSLSGTQMKPKGVLSLDATFLTHGGKHFDKIAYLDDHTQGCYVWAHNLVNLHDRDDQTDYPGDFRFWEPVEVAELEAGLKGAGVPLRESKYPLKASDPQQWRQYLLGVGRRHQKQPEVQQLYHSKWLLAQQRLTQFFSDHPTHHWPVTCDTWYTHPAFCRFLNQPLQIAYVGTLSGPDQVLLTSGAQRLDAFALHRQQEHHQALKQGHQAIFRKVTIAYKGEPETYYSYGNTHRIHNVGKQRLVINHRKADLSDPAAFFISNRLNWQAHGITRIRRHRWPVEVYHEEGKADGLDQYQGRDFQAIYRHIAFVAVTYSLLRAAQHDHALLHTLQQQIKTKRDGSAGSCRRQTQALWAFATLIATALSQGQTLSEVMQPLITAVCY